MTDLETLERAWELFGPIPRIGIQVLTLVARQDLGWGGSLDDAVNAFKGSSRYTVSLQEVNGNWVVRRLSTRLASDECNQPHPRAPATPATGIRRETFRLRGRILVAEDDREHQKLYAHVLQETGAEVACASDGHTACELALQAHSAGSPFDLILMDIRLPKLDGREATRRLRQAGYSGTIIALTACAMAGDREAFLAAGGNEYVTKPIYNAELLGIISRHIPQVATGNM